MPVLGYDEDIGGGWKWVKVYQPEFDDCFRYHDQGYSDLIAGTSTITLKELDRRFLKNMLRKAAKVAWLEKDVGLGVKLARRAWLYYQIARWWAQTVRKELQK